MTLRQQLKDMFKYRVSHHNFLDLSKIKFNLYDFLNRITFFFII